MLYTTAVGLGIVISIAMACIIVGQLGAIARNNSGPLKPEDFGTGIIVILCIVSAVLFCYLIGLAALSVF